MYGTLIIVLSSKFSLLTGGWSLSSNDSSSIKGGGKETEEEVNLIDTNLSHTNVILMYMYDINLQSHVHVCEASAHAACIYSLPKKSATFM